MTWPTNQPDPSNWQGIQGLSLPAEQMFDPNYANSGNGSPPVSSVIPANPGWQSWGDSKGFGDFLGANMGTFAAGLQGVGKIAGLYMGLKQLSLAKNAFKLQKSAYNTNLANSTQSYNTQVGDRIAGRSYASEEERQAALNAAKLPAPKGY